MSKNTHGGVREGAGRYTIEKGKQKRRQVMLDDERYQMAETLGQGNASRGIRKALDYFNEVKGNEKGNIGDGAGSADDSGLS